jgi:hypothetical protein
VRSGKPGRLENVSIYQLKFYADDGDIMGGSVHIMENNKETKLVASK